MPVTRRRARFILLTLSLFAVLFAAVLPALAQDGGDCTNCPVSFGVHSALDPRSPEMAEINKLYNFIFWTAVAIFTVVEGALLITIWRFRNRPAKDAHQIHGNTKLEIVWTALPAVILAVLLGYTLRTMAAVRAPVTGDSVKVVVIGHQWWWEFQYPDLGIITANELVVPVGVPVEVTLLSKDVQHGFWAPQLFGKMDAIPGHTNRMHFTVNDAGRYGGQCTQFCGEQHAQMRLEVVGLSAAEFQIWAAGQQQPAAKPTDDSARRGQDAFLTGACVACHTIDGTTAAGKTGPNLTHLSSRSFIAGGVLSRTDENLKNWIHDAPAVKPGIVMPSFKDVYDDQTLGDIVAYLDTLK